MRGRRPKRARGVAPGEEPTAAGSRRQAIGVWRPAAFTNGKETTPTRLAGDTVQVTFNRDESERVVGSGSGRVPGVDGYDRCDTCRGTGQKPDNRPQGQPAILPVATERVAA